MNKIVLFSDNNIVSKSTLNFLYSLYQQEPFLLVGSFFPSANSGLIIPNTFAPGLDLYTAVKEDMQETIIESVKAFTHFCQKQNIEYRVHQQDDYWNMDDVIKESRFADLIVVNGEQFFNHEEKDQPNSYLRTLLRSAECAVMVVPEQMATIEKIGIAYDGKKESVFALKRFCALVPYFQHLPVYIHYWVHTTDDEIPQSEYIQEFASRHFTSVSFCEHFFDAGKYLSSWAAENKNTLFVCGSYARSKFSTWLKKSFVEDLISNHTAPVFIAHS